MLRRLDDNPLLTPEDARPTRQDLTVMCTLNPAAVRFGEEILLLVRVGEKAPQEPGWVAYLHVDAEAGETKIARLRTDDPDLDASDPRGYFYRGRMLLTSMSHLRLARSRDGRRFRFDAEPAIYPSTPYESYGCEDPRITPLDGRYYVCYTSVSDRGVTVSLAVTEDFAHFEKLGVIFPPYQKDVALFPGKVGGLYVARHRPFRSEFNPASIWTAYSPDLLSWGRHGVTLAPDPQTWESERVGCGAPPILTDEGWLEIYHASDHDGTYRLGAMLSDPQQPQRVLTRSRRPVFEPQADYELKGVYANCVFSNGLIAEADGTLTVYYGAADRICAAAVTTVEEMIAAAKNEA
jgi:predicted GH43/DUF377 family glycosyl hydrolase